MAEPEGDDGAIDAILEELHCRTVAQDVRRDALLLERCAILGSQAHMLPHDLLDGIAAEPFVAIADEHWIAFLPASW